MEVDLKYQKSNQMKKKMRYPMYSQKLKYKDLLKQHCFM